MSWISDIPTGWEVKRLKYLGTARNGLTYAPEDVATEGILVLRSSNIQNDELAFEDNVYVNMRIPREIVLQENDLLICSRNGSRELIGKCALIDKETAGNTYGAFMCVYRSLYNPFIHYVMLSDIFNYYLGTFLTSTINQLTNANLLNIEILLPPITEQRAIVSLLDDLCCQVDGIITDLEKQVEILKQYKKALITETVTKGLDKTASLKDSGIGWVGEIPETWEIIRITKYLESLVDYRGKTPEKVDDGVFLVTARNIKDGKIDYTLSQEYVREQDYSNIMRRGSLELGDVLFTTEAPMGEVANVDRTDFALAQRVVKFRGRKNKINNYFLKYWLMSSGFQSFLSTQATGSTALGVAASRFGFFKMPCPSLGEQAAIVEYLDRKCAETDDLIAEKQRAADVMRQYKKSLIYEYVTGKKRVIS